MTKHPLNTIILVILLTWASINAIGAPVSPDKAMSEAGNFLSGDGAVLRKSPSARSQQLTLAKTITKDGVECYYIFNFDNGFILSAADDRVNPILGYSENGNFDETRIPENMKWWLDNYASEISAYLKVAPANVQPVMSTSVHKVVRKAIEPLLKTKWDQGTPFNNDCPMDRNSNQRSATGCVATATAQIMKFHQWPQKPTGSNGGVTFEGTTYDWRNMIDEYVEGKYNSRQAAAVATLMHQVGASVNMMYSAYASGAYDSDVPVALTTYFDYSAGLRTVWKDYTPQVDWNNKVYAELAEGRPVYYSGSSNQGGHAFVCDGYSQNEYFHFNWGWGGYEDGYFLLSALNPAQGGAGSYEGGYNSHQTIITGIQPKSKNPDAQKQIALLATGGFYYDSNNKYVIKDGILEPYMIYNPMGYTVDVSVGLKVTGVTDPSYKRYVICESNYKIDPNYGFLDMTSPISNLPDGEYHVTPVFTQSNLLDWQDILVPLGKQSYVTLTVTNGKQSFKNNGPDQSYNPDIKITKPSSTSTIYANTSLAFRIPILNIGQGDYNDELGFSLFNKNDEFGDVASFTDNVAVAARSYRELEITLDQPLSPGTYVGDIVDRYNNKYVTNYVIQVKDGGFKTPTDTDVVISNISPSFYTSGTTVPIYFSIQNIKGNSSTTTFMLEVLDNKTLEVIGTIPGDYTISADGSDVKRAYIRPLDFKLDAGEYMLRACDLNREPLSVPYPLIVRSETKTSNGLAYIVTDEKNKSALLTAPLDEPYSSNVTVPESIDGYNIVGLRNDAFSFATSSIVTLGKNVMDIPGLSLYCDNLQSLCVLTSSVPTIASDALPYENASKCWVYTSNGLANDFYYSGQIWNKFSWSRWLFNLKDGVQIISGMEINPKTGNLYEPYCMNPDSGLEIGFSGPEGYNIEIILQRSDKTWIHVETIDPTKQKFKLPALGRYYGAIVARPTKDAVSVNEIEGEEEDVLLDVFTIDGRLVMQKSDNAMRNTLAPGLYILSNGKKIMKR